MNQLGAELGVAAAVGPEYDVGGDPDRYGQAGLWYRNPDWYWSGYHRFAAYAAERIGGTWPINWLTLPPEPIEM